MNSQKKAKVTSRLPSSYGQTLVQSEFDYRREIRDKLDQLQKDNRNSFRRHYANDHRFARDFLIKRHHWYNVDKSYRDRCRITWNRQAAASGRTSHVILPNIYPSENSSPLSMASITSVSSRGKDENPAITDERIKQNFLRVHPVMLEVLHTPHSSKALRYKQEVALRKKSAQTRQVHIQATATNDSRYQQLVRSLYKI